MAATTNEWPLKRLKDITSKIGSDAKYDFAVIVAEKERAVLGRPVEARTRRDAFKKARCEIQGERARGRNQISDRSKASQDKDCIRDSLSIPRKERDHAKSSPAGHLCAALRPRGEAPNQCHVVHRV
jgi:hypothetical protein